jgi:RHS repeat-associated protein
VALNGNGYISACSQQLNYVKGARHYELSNHLGNVLSVVSDRKIEVDESYTFQAGGGYIYQNGAYTADLLGNYFQNNPADGIIDGYVAEVISATDYYAFGSPMPGRSYQASEYRFGFNGQERDDEVKGSGNINTAEFWMYDGRLGRRLNLDPVIVPSESQYSTNKDNPIKNSDPKGDSPGGDPPKFSLNSGFSLNFSYTFGEGKKASNYNLGFASNVTGIGSVGNFSAQGSLNFSMMFTNGGLTKPFGQTGSSRSELIFSPAINVGGGGTSNALAVNYLHNNATTSLYNPIKYSGTYALNYHFTSDGRNQRTGTYGLRIGQFSFNILEDHKAWLGSDKLDQYFTGSCNINYQLANGTSFTFGTDTYTGRSNNKGSTAEELGDWEYGGTVTTFGKNKGQPFYWANQTSYDQSLNNAQTFFQISTSNGFNLRMTSTGPSNFWSQNMIHDLLTPNFHHFKPSVNGNSGQTTVGFQCR